MSREWTTRRTTSANEPAIDVEKFARAYPVYRVDPDQVDATKTVLRLLLGYTLLWLPVHCGIAWLANHSPGVAVAAVGAASVAMLLVGIAKWLSLDDLLQKLPLLLVLALIGIALAYLTSGASQKWINPAGVDLFLGVLVLIAVVSTLGSLYRPMAATYKAITVTTPIRDLCLGAAAMMVSLAVAMLGSVLPRPWMLLVASTACGGFAGLVLLEYACWARANPNVALEHAKDFGSPLTWRNDFSLLGGSLCFGAGYGLLTAFLEALSRPSPAFYRLLLSLASKQEERVPDVLGVWVLIGAAGIVAGFLLASSSVDALRLVSPSPIFRLSWEALRVFLAYPEVGHPLAHKCRMPWLRPTSVRIGLAGLMLITVATASIPFVRESNATSRAATKPEDATAPKPPTPRFKTSSGPNPLWPIGPGFDPIHREQFGVQEMAPIPPTSPPPMPSAEVTDSEPSQVTASTLLVAVLGVVFGPPLCAYFMVCFIGLAILPTHFNYFERPVPKS